ncbi:uncharacterized protein LOC127510229 [Ctenopharyngodon idella]|uniref:uncharacterized protein LOC127510229 n=1 Tax=Ctenopharyngodon idella TaxID=7959 RepID=UPI00222EB9BD|nr:uncharacterized protein LOC127510229 [Ctenopharyngodon idella]XP_051745765.1 uncharacterized protein LOC127510229 [Ctenopharyngodon idella]
MANPRSACPESVPSQAAVQDAYAETHFRMHLSPGLVCSDQPGERKVRKDAYFHVSILPRHRPFLRFAFEGRAYQYKVLPFRLALSPHIFTKVAEVAIVPLKEQGVRILNYLGDWLILASSREQLCEHRDMVLAHLSRLGLRVNWDKSKLAPMQRISYLGMELDSVAQTARLTEERVQSVLNCLSTLKRRTAAPLKLFQRLLGHMASAAAVTPLGLLHTRPLQHWLHGRVPRWPRDTELPSHSHQVVGPFVPAGWSSPRTSVQACCGPHRCLCHGVGGHVQQACSVGSVDGASTAVAYQLPRVASSISCTGPLPGAVDRQACTDLLGQHCGRCVHQPSGWSTPCQWFYSQWFSDLTLLTTAPPWPIPLRKDLLTQRRGTLWHPRPDPWF